MSETVASSGTGLVRARAGFGTAPRRGFGEFTPRGVGRDPEAAAGARGGGAPIKVEAHFTFDGKHGAALEVTETAVSLIFERLAAEQGL
jgi:hypothetical protein